MSWDPDDEWNDRDDDHRQTPSSVCGYCRGSGYCRVDEDSADAEQTESDEVTCPECGGSGKDR